MNTFLQQLKTDSNECGDTLYFLDEIKEKATKIVEINNNNWLVLYTNKYYDDSKSLKDCWLQFALLQFSQSELNGDNTLVSCVFSGEGPTSSLREFRHTYWGKDGYNFYLPIDATIKALTYLKEFYD